jgi:hypothetical protein
VQADSRDLVPPGPQLAIEMVGESRDQGTVLWSRSGLHFFPPALTCDNSDALSILAFESEHVLKELRNSDLGEREYKVSRLRERGRKGGKSNL